jgi:hypothetical protein
MYQELTSVLVTLERQSEVESEVLEVKVAPLPLALLPFARCCFPRLVELLKRLRRDY